MTQELHLDSSRLAGKFVKRFKEIETNVVASYKLAIDSLVDKSLLPYVPTVRVTPFVVVKVRKGKGVLFKQTYYGFTFVDVDDFEKSAIYPSLDFLEKFPNYVAAGLGHELGHVIAFGRERVTLKEMAEVLVAPLQAEKRKEAEMKKVLDAFDPKFRAIIVEWNGVSTNKDSKEFLVENAWQVNTDFFQSYVFGKRRKFLDEFLVQKGARMLKEAKERH